MFSNATWWITTVLIVDILIRALAVVIVPRNRRPTSGMAWLLAIFFLPSIGVILFLIIGSPKLPRKRREVQAEINDFIKSVTEDGHHDDPEAPDWFNSLVELNSNLGALPLLEGNGATLHGDYQETLDAMTADIDTATSYVHVQFYILSLDATTKPFFDALERAIGRGVHVNVLLDHWASMRKPFSKETRERLTGMGASWELMLPLQPLKGKLQRPDLRNHRKILIIDGRVGFMGSLNLIDETYNMKSNIKRGLKWKELVARVEGPVVAALDAIFISDWYSETGEVIRDGVKRAEHIASNASFGELGPAFIDRDDKHGDLQAQIVPSGPGFEGENNLRLFLGMLYGAQERIVITSPYFVPDESLMYAVTTAVQRGVPVDLFVSEIGDQALVYHAQRSYYEELLRAGVRIYLYPAPYILHAKHFTIDSDVALIGSSNMDMRSFGLNMEVSMLIRGESFVREMRVVEDEYRSISRELTLEEWMRQPLRSTVLDNLARLTSALQ